MSSSLLRAALFALFVLLISSTPATAQSHIEGTVLDSETGKPLHGANVFLENTLYGTATDKEGNFELTGLDQGTFTLVVSMVGYARRERTVTVSSSSQDNSSSNHEISLTPDPVELKGIRVEGDRSKWLEHLEEFRESFFGKPENAEECEFINPEVLAFELIGDTLVARAKQPLRIRNNALGYEVTYHLPRYETYSRSWTRYGTAEFDTIRAQNDKVRADWKEARRHTYKGSLYHFLDALKANDLEKEGFRVKELGSHQIRRGRIQGRDLKGGFISDASEIFTSLDESGKAILSPPNPANSENILLIQYNEDGDFSPHSYGPRQSRISMMRFVGSNRTVINSETGNSIRMGTGYYTLRGFWGWHMTAATALPANYHPSNK